MSGMSFRRLIVFVIIVPVFPLLLLAAMIDDEAETGNVIECVKKMWRRVYEKQ